MKKITDKEIVAIVKLPPDERYEYGLKIIADQEELYSLKDKSGWVVYEDEDGVEMFPIWPHPAYAQLSAVGKWQGAVPEKMSLDTWFQKESERLSEEEMGIAFFPVPQGKAEEISLEKFLEDLEEEMEQYE